MRRKEVCFVADLLLQLSLQTYSKFVMYWQAFLFLPMCYVSVQTTYHQRDRRIINGHPIPTGTRHPASVSFKRWDKEGHQFQHFCGGIIVHVTWVLSAAHCFPRGRLPVPLKLQIEEVDWYHVEELIRYPQQERMATVDLALLRTSEMIRGTIAHLPPPGFKPRGECQVCGLGTISSKSHVFPKTLRCATVPIVQRNVCEQTLKPYIKLQPGTLCAGGGNTDACVGDSGSSLHCRSEDNGKQVLAGVVSWGRGCAVAGEPGIYTDVAFHRKWLLETISGPLNDSSSEREDNEDGIFATKIHVLGSRK